MEYRSSLVARERERDPVVPWWNRSLQVILSVMETTCLANKDSNGFKKARPLGSPMGLSIHRCCCCWGLMILFPSIVCAWLMKNAWFIVFVWIILSAWRRLRLFLALVFGLFNNTCVFYSAGTWKGDVFSPFLLLCQLQRRKCLATSSFLPLSLSLFLDNGDNARQNSWSMNSWLILNWKETKSQIAAVVIASDGSKRTSMGWGNVSACREIEAVGVITRDEIRALIVIYDRTSTHAHSLDLWPADRVFAKYRHMERRFHYLETWRLIKWEREKGISWFVFNSFPLHNSERWTPEGRKGVAVVISISLSLVPLPLLSSWWLF